jgi:hypothetical protein
VTSLFTFVPTAANVSFYIDIVRDKYMLRETIATCTETVRRAYEPDADDERTRKAILDVHELRIASIRALHGRNGADQAVSIIDLAAKDPREFEKDNLLGNRFLCREGGMLFVAPSGIGKSTAGVQMDIAWALGCDAFGIKPARPIKTLCIQAENDDGDLSEMAKGVLGHLGLTDEQRELVDRNVIYVSERAATGSQFLALLRQLVRKHHPDIVRIDPLQAYAGGDVIDQKVTTPFLRNGLNPILKEFRCAAVINHHTPKTTYRDTSEWTATDWMYAGAGNADITNWARAILVADATHVHGAYTFRAAKRGSRIGWADEDGHPVFERLFCWSQNGNVIFWRDATDEDAERVAAAKQGKPLRTKEDLKRLVPMDKPIPKNTLLANAGDAEIGEKKARGLLAELIDNRELFVWQLKRSGTRPEVHIARREQTLSDA